MKNCLRILYRSDLALANGSIDETFYYTGDSAKVSLFYKIVPR